MSSEKQFEERRKHKRYQARPDAYAVFSEKARHAARIIDISKGGLSFCYANGEPWLEEAAELDIFLGDDEFSLNRIPFETVADYMLPIASSTGHTMVSQRCVRFGKLTPKQIYQLSYFIEASNKADEDTDHI